MPLPKPNLLAGWRRAKLIALINELYQLPVIPRCGRVIRRSYHVWGMADAGIFLRSEPGAAELRRLARRESGRVCQRVLLIANMLEGMEHEEAARLAGLSRSAAYEWHNRYEEDGLEGLRDRPRPGRQPRVDSHGSTPRRVRGSRTGLSLAPSWRGTGWWRFAGFQDE